jgi:hypothetical protein
MFSRPTPIAYAIERIVMVKNIPPPQGLVAVVFSCAKSSLYLGSHPTKQMAETCMNVVKYVKLIMPCNSPSFRVSLSTSQMPKSMVLRADDKVKALLFTVVNIAYEAPSDPAGVRWTIMIVVGFRLRGLGKMR